MPHRWPEMISQADVELHFSTINIQEILEDCRFKFKDVPVPLEDFAYLTRMAVGVYLGLHMDGKYVFDTAGMAGLAIRLHTAARLRQMAQVRAELSAITPIFLSALKARAARLNYSWPNREQLDDASQSVAACMVLEAVTAMGLRRNPSGKFSIVPYATIVQHSHRHEAEDHLVEMLRSIWNEYAARKAPKTANRASYQPFVVFVSTCLERLKLNKPVDAVAAINRTGLLI